ncbi:hypothetical protein ACTXT7_000392 [Hymenolepis weldensis]
MGSEVINKDCKPENFRNTPLAFIRASVAVKVIDKGKLNHASLNKGMGYHLDAEMRIKISLLKPFGKGVILAINILATNDVVSAQICPKASDHAR